MFYRTAEPMTAQGPQKREPSQVLVLWNFPGLHQTPRAQSEAAPDGSCPCGSDPRIYQSRSIVAPAPPLSSALLSKRNAPDFTSGSVFLAMPVEVRANGARQEVEVRVGALWNVLAYKGPLLATPDNGVPLPARSAVPAKRWCDGRLRREHSTSSVRTGVQGT